MFKTVLIDDTPQNIQLLEKLLRKNSPQIEIVGEAQEVESAFKLITKTKPDLVILDAVLTSGNAFDLLDKLMPLTFEVIFITAHDNYSIKAIRYSAMDYLLKPVKAEELESAVSRAIKKIMEKRSAKELEVLISGVKNAQYKNPKIAIPTGDGYMFVIVDDIVRCEANGTYTYIFTTKKEKIIASKNIKEYEDLLPKDRFFRIHNSHLVNISKILKYTKGRGGTVTMEDGTEIDVASRRRAEFLEMFQ